MAITSITIYQDNVYNGSNLMPVHSPLVFLVDVVYNTAIPDYINCKVYDSTPTLLDTFKCIPYLDISATERRFMFIADSILRGYMNGFDDFEQTSDTLEYVEYITKEFTLYFSDPDAGVADEDLEIVAMCGASQFGSYPNKDTIFNNASENIIAVSGKPCYLYYYNEDTANTLSIDGITTDISAPSQIGYYRLKKAYTVDTDQTIYIGGVETSAKSVLVKSLCTNGKILKYLNSEGQYRFFAFNDKWESSDKPKEIGRTNKIITSLFNSQANERSVGYNNTRKINITADSVSQSELDILQDIWTSPKVLLYVGTSTDLVSDWVEVKLSSKDAITRIRKGGFKDISFDIELPKWYSIGLL